MDGKRDKRKRSDSVLWQTPLYQQKSQTQTSPPKSSIKQRLWTDLGRSVGVTTAIQLVLLTGLRAQPFHSQQQPCNQNDTHLNICEQTSLYKQKKTATPNEEVIKIDTQTA